MADIQVQNNLDLNGQKVKGAANASAADEYVTLSQAQALFRGINKYFVVEARATGNVTIATLDAGQALDGVTLAEGDLVLLDQQSTAAEDGIYLINADGNAATRYVDWDAGQPAEGIAVTVVAGSTHGDKLFVQTAEDTVVGTDGLTFAQIGSGSASGGAGMTSGFDIQAADTSITVGADDIAVALNGTGGLEVSSGVRVKMPSNPGLTRDGTGIYVDPDTGITVGASGVGVDFSIVPKKFSTATHASSTSITVTHSLGTENVVVSVRLEGGAKSAILVDWVTNDSNSIILQPAVAPSANTWRITVMG